VAFGAACQGQRADRPGPQQGAPAHVSSAVDFIMLRPLAAYLFYEITPQLIPFLAWV